MQKSLHILCSLWLACLLLFGAAPKEVLHELFAGHHDTEHRHDIEGPAMDAAHHHCNFVAFELMPFAAPPSMPFVQRVVLPEYLSFFPLQDLRALQQVIALREGRGPPAA